MRKYITISLLLLSLTSLGQKVSYNLKVSYNQPFIADIEAKTESLTYWLIYNETLMTTTKETFKTKSGVKIGGNIIYALTSRAFIEGGMQLKISRFQRKVIYENLDYLLIEVKDTSSVFDYLIEEDHSRQHPNEEKNGNTAILFFDIPLKIGYGFFNHKLKCKAGLTTSFVAYSQVFHSEYSRELGTYGYTDISSDIFQNVVLNGSVEVDYLIYKNMGLNLSNNRSITSVYDNYASIGNPKFNVFSLGLSFGF